MTRRCQQVLSRPAWHHCHRLPQMAGRLSANSVRGERVRRQMLVLPLRHMEFSSCDISMSWIASTSWILKLDRFCCRSKLAEFLRSSRPGTGAAAGPRNTYRAVEALLKLTKRLSDICIPAQRRVGGESAQRSVARAPRRIIITCGCTQAAPGLQLSCCEICERSAAA